jgi:hypothetical protein
MKARQISNEGTKSTIFEKLKFCIFVIMQPAKNISRNRSIDFQVKNLILDDIYLLLESLDLLADSFHFYLLLVCG